MTQSSHSCCPAYDPCPHRLCAQDRRPSLLDRARAADGVDREAVDLALDQRGISRRGILAAGAGGCRVRARRSGPCPRPSAGSMLAPMPAGRVGEARLDARRRQ
jgi:hypothetical protein